MSILSQGKNKVFFVHDYNPMSHLIHGPEPERSFQTKMYELLQGVTGNLQLNELLAPGVIVNSPLQLLYN